MSFISYSQNYEDVMLWRALKDVKDGFYIDVGAAWPDKHTVTKAFYDRGWRGINIEPNPIHQASLKQQRPRDINLQLAIGEHTGELTMTFVGDSGLSTLVEDIAIQHKANGYSVRQQITNIQTLSLICDEYVSLGQSIHFLKVDVEGFEEQVLKSHNWTNYRPWIVIVEATLPMTQEESFANWEPILKAAGYFFAYADGLNRFYVSHEQSHLINSFKYPPNVFDGFLLNEQVLAEAKVQLAEAVSYGYLAKLNAVFNIKSWRITAPFRRVMNQLNLWYTQGFNKRAKGEVKKILHTAYCWVAARPKLKKILLQIAYNLCLAHRLIPLMRKLSIVHPTSIRVVNLQALSPRAMKFYQDLKQTQKLQIKQIAD